MAKLTDFTTPTGAKGNIFDLKSIWGMILGVIVLLFAVAMGQNLAGAVSRKIPAFDTSINPLVQRPVAVDGGQRKIIL